MSRPRAYGTLYSCNIYLTHLTMERLVKLSREQQISKSAVIRQLLEKEISDAPK